VPGPLVKSLGLKPEQRISPYRLTTVSEPRTRRRTPHESFSVSQFRGPAPRASLPRGPAGGGAPRAMPLERRSAVAATAGDHGLVWTSQAAVWVPRRRRAKCKPSGSFAVRAMRQAFKQQARCRLPRPASLFAHRAWPLPCARNESPVPPNNNFRGVRSPVRRAIDLSQRHNTGRSQPVFARTSHRYNGG